MASVDIELEDRVTTEEERVIQWRLDALERAGYDEVTALELALTPGVDLHRATGLVARGCSPQLASQILL